MLPFSKSVDIGGPGVLLTATAMKSNGSFLYISFCRRLCFNLSTSSSMDVTASPLALLVRIGCGIVVLQHSAEMELSDGVKRRHVVTKKDRFGG